VGVGLPFVEVHVTNVYAREPERRHSMLAPAARAVLCGFGPAGYELALRGLAEVLGAPPAVAAFGATDKRPAKARQRRRG
jgi:3-dehydroquinate dehydratase-2